MGSGVGMGDGGTGVGAGMKRGGLEGGKFPNDKRRISSVAISANSELRSTSLATSDVSAGISIRVPGAASHAGWSQVYMPGSKISTKESLRSSGPRNRFNMSRNHESCASLKQRAALLTDSSRYTSKLSMSELGRINSFNCTII